MVALLAFAPGETSAQAPQAGDKGAVVISKGLRGRIQDGELRKARLVFTDTAVTVEVEREIPERFDYDSLALRKGSHHMGVPIFDKWFWWQVLPQVPLHLALDGISGGAYFLATQLAAACGLHFALRARSHHWLSLHSSREEHRCAHLVLPRKKKLRLAISEEFAARDPRGLLVRPPLPAGLRDLHPFSVVGAPAPDFELAALDGGTVRLSELAGKGVVLNFWATWCGPCREELPHLERLSRRYARDELVVLGVSDEDPDQTRNFLAQQGITYTALHDAGGRVFRNYGVRAIPTTVVVGRDGVVATMIEGYSSESRLSQAVKQHIGALADPLRSRN